MSSKFPGFGGGRGTGGEYDGGGSGGRGYTRTILNSGGGVGDFVGGGSGVREYVAGGPEGAPDGEYGGCGGGEGEEDAFDAGGGEYISGGGRRWRVTWLWLEI
jgi:hypothetical protein